MWLEIKSAERHLKLLEVITLLSGLFFFLGSQFAGAAVCAALIIFIRFHLHYSEHAGSDMTFIENEQAERLNVEDEADWTVAFRNGKYPIRDVTMTLTFTNHATFLNKDSIKVGQTIQWTGQLSMEKYEEVRVSIPIKAVKRGKFKMVSCQLHIPHLFGYGYKLMQYKGHFRQEKRIYPETEHVKFSSYTPAVRPGESMASFSLYEDLTMRAGTREYRAGDTMQRINWAAYAKTGQLQTNIYEPVIEEKYMIILNVTYKHAKNIHFEKLIKQAAFMITDAHRLNRTIGLCINVRTKEAPNFYYIAPDKGVSHSRKCLEMLSILSIGDVTMPVNPMINQLSIMQAGVTDYIYIGDTSSSERLSSLNGRVWIAGEQEGGAVRWKQQLTGQ